MKKERGIEVFDYRFGTATFVMPHWRNENVLSKRYLDEAICSVKNQTDSNWHLVIVDDCSPCKEARNYLDIVKEQLDGTIS